MVTGRKNRDHLQLPSGDLVVDELLISPLLLRDGDIGQGRLEVQDLLHLLACVVLLPTQEDPQLHHEVEVSGQNLQDEEHRES